ncbi:ADP-ribose pyrophosphatase YjhB (NUDIX family) [Thermocatellispora tengchongensis]|uniref:ADP-ribose pyrophosphatase YjhB (NUDIX family) n=1 Tax=Thermocatellispora tengchongensis TaxID=1073253 RepID=A0A840P321_9ACTN|nr:NUDIX domain-containing protein [Thermocatellispora tengchongensis]MBB5132271.1 ADP-ribose pyrophosphatase YjhB (NUDIX family) [Thermocatellispora tengchongensis]
MTATASSLVTHHDGRVLLVRSAGGRWRLPRAALASRETPRQAALRAVSAAVGLAPRLGRPLVLDSVDDAPHYVFDGGEAGLSAARRIGTSPTAAFARPAEVDMRPDEARRIDVALRARAACTTEYLENGVTPGVLAAMREFGIAPWLHSGAAWIWHEEPVPDDLKIRHSWVWLFAPDGRVVVYVDVNGICGLPGGTVERAEGRDAAATAVREVREETQMEMTDPVYLGYLLDTTPGRRPVARVRMAAAITAVGPAAPDPATGTVHRRLLVPPRLIGELCGWHTSADRQVAAALAAVSALGIGPAPPDARITEIPADGTGVLG